MVVVASEARVYEIANGEFAERSDRVAMIDPIIARSVLPGCASRRNERVARSVAANV
jgi:hypothetical protein